MRDPISDAFAHVLRDVVGDLLDDHRAAIRADVLHILESRTLDGRATDAAALSTDEAADYLSVSARTVARMRADGRLPAVRVGRQVRFRREDLDAYLERNIESTT